MPKNLDKNCYCGKHLSYKECCKHFHDGTLAPTPEALMRSRFSAFATANVPYIMKTQVDELNLEIDEASFTQQLQTKKWVLLEVLQAVDDQVTFRAFMIYNDILYTLNERSLFVKDKNRWLYAKALSHEDSERTLKRNELCPCGSGKKYKQCCQKV